MNLTFPAEDAQGTRNAIFEEQNFQKKSLEVPLQNVISPSQKELIEVSSKITRNEREYILVT